MKRTRSYYSSIWNISFKLVITTKYFHKNSVLAEVFHKYSVWIDSLQRECVISFAYIYRCTYISSNSFFT